MEEQLNSFVFISSIMFWTIDNCFWNIVGNIDKFNIFLSKNINFEPINFRILFNHMWSTFCIIFFIKKHF